MLAHEGVQVCPRVVGLGIALVAAEAVCGLQLNETFCTEKGDDAPVTDGVVVKVMGDAVIGQTRQGSVRDGFRRPGMKFNPLENMKMIMTHESPI